MTLQAHSPGVWINDNWKPGTPGTFAVVIGVSVYQHLDGSSQKFRLGQLFVSATTAYGFLRWLENGYRLTGSPLAKCWMLLSPTPGESAANPSLSQNIMEPTFDNCDRVLRDWHLVMANLPPESAVKSRSVFFFSGHGLEVIEDRQVLLPSDYLGPGVPIDRAISTQNISRGLKSLCVPTHFLFLDACRNDHDNLGQFAPLDGTKILNEPSNKAINPDCLVPIFYGSAPGEQAFGPKDPKLGSSLLGQALIEGLRANGLEPDCTTGICYIDLHMLRPFVQNRIAEIARTRYRSSIIQRVRVRGDQTEEAVTEVTPLQPEGGRKPSGPPPPLSDLVNQTLSVQAPTGVLRPTITDDATAHRFFGSERVTAVWTQNAQVYDFETATWLERGQDIEVLGLRRTPDASSIEFDFRIPGARLGATYWLQLEDERRTFACALPLASVPRLPDNHLVETRFRMEMDFGRGMNIERFEVSISPDNHSEFFLDSAAAMWKLYNEASSREAERRYNFVIPQDANMLEELVRHKYYSPFAATIAGAILVRARQWDKLKDWLRNLANIRPYVPDAQVLWVEQCLRQPDATFSLDESVQYFLRLKRLPLPFLAETLGHALRQADDLLAGTDVAQIDKIAIQEIRSRLQTAVGLFRAGGMFATFAGPKGEVEPDIVMPAKIQSELPTQEVEAPLSEAEINEMVGTDSEQAAEKTAADVEEHSEPDSEEHKGYA
jgi:hypothetical protein